MNFMHAFYNILTITKRKTAKIEELHTKYFISTSYIWVQNATKFEKLGTKNTALCDFLIIIIIKRWNFLLFLTHI